MIVDGDVLLAESGAVMDYILARHGGGRLMLGAGRSRVSGLSVLAALRERDAATGDGARCLILGRLALPADNPVLLAAKGRLDPRVLPMSRRG